VAARASPEVSRPRPAQASGGDAGFEKLAAVGGKSVVEHLDSPEWDDVIVFSTSPAS
jgi:hypothetical protein